MCRISDQQSTDSEDERTATDLCKIAAAEALQNDLIKPHHLVFVKGMSRMDAMGEIRINYMKLLMEKECYQIIKVPMESKRTFYNLVFESNRKREDVTKLSDDAEVLVIGDIVDVLEVFEVAIGC